MKIIRNNLSILFFLFFGPISFAVQGVSIYPADAPEFFALFGEDGGNGIAGHRAYSLDCSDGVFRHGRDGDPGYKGETGEKGKNALIYYDDIKDLKNITLDQHGGFGGIPGDGGEGTNGCHGGKPGVEGPIGKPGSIGEYGDIFLFHKNESFLKGDATKVISLQEFSQRPIELTKIQWSFHEGARDLFGSESKIKNYYKKYKKQIRYTVKLKWSAAKDLTKYGNTQLAFSVKGDGLEVTSYSGPIIDFSISKIGNEYTFEVFDANTDDEFKNLHFGKLRGFGEDISFDVEETFTPSIVINTRFIMSLYSVTNNSDETPNGQNDVFITQLQVKNEFVSKDEKIFHVQLGKMNFPSRFKTKGTKLRIHLSIYREARQQTRVFALKGLFKI